MEAYRAASPPRRAPPPKAAAPSASAWNHVPTVRPPSPAAAQYGFMPPSMDHDQYGYYDQQP
eukprot:scaffold49802_cov36-Phaeocystis_antarctica.AAC.2